MKTQRIHEWIGILAIVCWTMGSGTASGQTFSSGSTGADGAYAPTCAPTPCTVTQALPPSGIYNYTTVSIPSGVTVQYTRNAVNTPVTLLAAGDVTIMGTISVNGDNGLNGSNTGQVVNPGGLGGPGGFNGGIGNLGNLTLFPGANGGQGPGGGNLTPGNPILTTLATYGAPSTFVSLLPLFGGSGGFGNFINPSSGVGGSGGGGGGAIVIASSSKISVTGSITANGGAGGNPNSGGNCTSGGSGGAIRLVAPEVSGTGSLQAI